MRAAVTALLIGLVAACSTGGGANRTLTPSTPSAATPVAPTIAGESNPAGLVFWLHLADAAYIVDDAGMALYTFDNDTGSSSTCYEQCAENWPPVIATGLPSRDTGVGGTVETFARTDGKGSQIRYNGDPLYYYVGDTAAGQTNGDNVGGVWHLAGVASTASPSAAPASPSQASSKPSSGPGDCSGYYCDDY